MITLAGKEYEIRFTLGSMKKFKKATGKSMMDKDTMKKIDEEILSALIWSMVDSDLTIDEIDNMVKLKDIEPITKKIFEAIENDTPKNEGKK